MEVRGCVFVCVRGGRRAETEREREREAYCTIIWVKVTQGLGGLFWMQDISAEIFLVCHLARIKL